MSNAAPRPSPKLLAKPTVEGFSPLRLLDRLLPVYGDVVVRLARAGAGWIAFDEPCLVQDRTPEELAAVRSAYGAIARAKGEAKLVPAIFLAILAGLSGLTAP